MNLIPSHTARILALERINPLSFRELSTRDGTTKPTTR